MRKFSEAETAFAEGGVACGVRLDGRGRLDVRPTEVETGVLPGANGSARVRLGGCAPLTEAVVGVKAELSAPSADAPRRGRLRFGVRIAADAAETADAAAADDAAAETCRALARVVGDSAALDLRQLCVVPRRRCWDLAVDAVVLSRGAGSLVDAVSVAVRAALAATRLPRITVVSAAAAEDEAAAVASDDAAVDDDDAELELDVDEDAEAAVPFDASGVPVAVTISRVGSHHIADASALEEACASARLVVGVAPSGALCGLHKIGRGGLSPSAIPEMIRAAQRIGLATIKSLDSALRLEAEQSREPIGFF